MTEEHTQLFLEAKLTPRGEARTGKEWDVTIIGAKENTDVVTDAGRQYIRSKNGRLYSVDALRESAGQWDGVKVYDNHLTQAEFEQKQGMRSPVKEWLGTIVQPYWDDKAKQLRGTFKVVEDALAGKLKSAWEQGVLGSIGLSIDTFPNIGGQMVFEGRQMPIIEGFKKILSVDLVGDPAAGGGFNRILASQNIMEAIEMDEAKVKELIDAALTEKVGATVKTALAEALAAEAEQLEMFDEDEAQEADTDEEHAQEMKKGKKKMKKEDEDEEEMMFESDDEDEAEDKASEALWNIRLLESKLLLKERLDQAKLPDKYRKPIERMFEGRLVEEEELDEIITMQKKAQADEDPGGHITEASGQRGNIKVGLNPDQKYALEIQRLIMGPTAFKALEHNDDETVKERVAESQDYRDWINDGRPNFGGGRMSNLLYNWFGGDPFIDPRAMEAATTSTLSTVVKNTVNIMIAADYSQRERWYEALVNTEEVDTIDDATLARLYGVSTLSVVEEGAAYTELAMQDEEETAEFVKKGNYVAITMETLMRDKINFVRRIPRTLTNTWYNTLSSLVSGVFTVNSATGPVLGTTGALFNATAVGSTGGHANLLTTALSWSSFGAARTAMRKQTDQPSGNGRKLQINPRYLLVPEDLETTALQIRNSEQLPGSANNDINPYYQKFDVIVVPDWTDTNNWALVGDPRQFPAIWNIFPRGGRVPQLFTADNETQGTMFTNDTLRYKIRMLTYRFSSTYDCAPVSDFRPLHKSNVS